MLLRKTKLRLICTFWKGILHLVTFLGKGKTPLEFPIVPKLIRKDQRNCFKSIEKRLSTVQDYVEETAYELDCKNLRVTPSLPANRRLWEG